MGEKEIYQNGRISVDESDMQRIQECIRQMTLEEKAGLCSGADNWNTKEVKRLGIPSIRMSDGPHGLRIMDEVSDDEEKCAPKESRPAVCFPAACASACSFDRALQKELGQALGRECQAEGIQILLGPGINMKRSPLCGRNFEYYSEDPYLAGELGASYVEGVQSEGAGTCLKHFFANNQEYRRMDASSEMDERTMREIYLPAFEKVVKQAEPWSVMASYNKIDGTFSTENRKYLVDLLRDEWGYKGAVISDWGAVHDRIKAVAGGTNLTMPGVPESDHDIVEAMQDGRLSEADLDAACTGILKLVFEAEKNRKTEVRADFEKDHQLARKIAAESMVLLKNEEQILPLKENTKIAFIGGFLKEPRFQGGGSSHINYSKVTNVLDRVQEEFRTEAVYAQGYPAGDTDPDRHLIEEAVRSAVKADTAVIFAGLPLRYNNDKQKKPLFSRGLSVCRLLFNSFSKLKIDENYKEKRRLFY